MPTFEPYKIKSIRHLAVSTLPERRNRLREVAYNVARLPSGQVTFDLVSQGSSAWSQEQVAALFLGDEAYAGARNFYHLEAAVRDVLGLRHVCPTHNRTGALKLITAVRVRPGDAVAGNTDTVRQLAEYGGATFHRLTLQAGTGDVDPAALDTLLAAHAGRWAGLFLDPAGDGFLPMSLANLEAVRAACDRAGVRLVLDASCVTEVAHHVRATTPALADTSIVELVHAICATAHVVVFDAGQDAMCNVGGFIASNDEEEYEHYMNEVVVYEGLHTYGGMAGRTMEAVAVGLREMVDESLVDWIACEVGVLSDVLTGCGVPHRRGLDGVYLEAGAFIAGPTAAATLAAALYLSSGIRALLAGPYVASDLLPVRLPRRALTTRQVREIGQAIAATWEQRPQISALALVDTPAYHHEATYEWLVPNLEPWDFDCEPFTIHAIEHVSMVSREARRQAMVAAGFNTFLLRSEDCTIDFLTDSGTAAQSVEQWLGYLEAQETPGTSEASLDLVATAQETYGYQHIIPTHQGRAAEHIMSQMFIRKGDYVPGNMYFTTTREHQELAGGVFVDVIVDEAHDPRSPFQWKGNVDLAKMQALYEKATAEGRRLAYLSYEFNVNLAGGQPVSMDNIRDVYAWCRAHDVPVFFDATRCTENAYFIQKLDARYHDTPVADILLEMFSYGDGATISCKKDQLTNLSGMLLFRDNPAWHRRALQMLEIFEGPWTSGGTSAGDMAAHAQGLLEMVQDDYIRNRVEQTRTLGQLLMDAGIPIVTPPGGHAIFLDAKAFLPHLDQDQFPAQALAAAIFIETGVRSMERGNVSKGRNAKTGQNFRPALELVRLTIPRRVYTDDHMKMVAEGIQRIWNARNTVRGLRFVYEPARLRFFQARFEEI